MKLGNISVGMRKKRKREKFILAETAVERGRKRGRELGHEKISE